jgi:hypothetical protein
MNGFGSLDLGLWSLVFGFRSLDLGVVKQILSVSAKPQDQSPKTKVQRPKPSPKPQLTTHTERFLMLFPHSAAAPIRVHLFAAPHVKPDEFHTQDAGRRSV